MPRLAAWVEAATGLELDERGSVRVLDRAAWLERRRRLEQLGGPPPADPAPRLDPILFGGNPAARGDAWKERGLWDRAEAAYAEAVRARPLNRSVRRRPGPPARRARPSRPGRGDARRGGPADARRHGSANPRPRSAVVRRSGRLAEVERRAARSLRRDEQHVDGQRGRLGLRAGARGDRRSRVPVRLAEAAIKGAETSEGQLPEHARRRALPRRPVRRGDPPAGGRIRPGAERVCPRTGRSWRWPTTAWGIATRPAAGSTGCGTISPARTRPVLGRAGDPPARSEAEAVVLYDPVFPADPFAH